MKKLFCSIFGHLLEPCPGFPDRLGRVDLEAPGGRETRARVWWVCPRCHEPLHLGYTTNAGGETQAQVRMQREMWRLEKELKDLRRTYRDYRTLMEAPISPAVTTPPAPPQKKVDELQKGGKMEGSTSKGVHHDSSDPLLDPAVSNPLYWGFGPRSSDSPYGGGCSPGESSSSSSDSGSCSSE